MGGSRRIGMAGSAIILDLHARLEVFSAVQITGTDRRFPMPARNVEHIGGLAETGIAAVQRAHEPLSLLDRGAQMRGPRREIAMMEIVGLDSGLDQGAHQ